MRLCFVILAMIFVNCGICSPIHSIVSARGLFNNKEETSNYTAADYIQDGLIAMWDGIENVGWGEHDDNATSWIDLTGKGANWLLKDSHTPEVFEVGVDYVKILNVVNYNGRGHCTATWTYGDDVKTMEIVLDNSDYDYVSGNVARIVSFGIGSGGWAQTLHVRGLQIAPSAYNRYPMCVMSIGNNYISLEVDNQIAFVNGKFITSDKILFANYTYTAPILSAYSASAAIGMKIKSMRIYNKILSNSEKMHNYKIDKARFEL